MDRVTKKDGKEFIITEAFARAALVLNFGELIDEHKNGKGFIKQSFVFYDARTGMDESTAIVLPNSGFQVEQVFEKVGNKYFTRVTKTPSANHGSEMGIMAEADTKQFSQEIKE